MCLTSNEKHVEDSWIQIVDDLIHHSEVHRP